MTIEAGLLLTLLGLAGGGGTTWGIFKKKVNGMEDEIKRLIAELNLKVNKEICVYLHATANDRFDKLDRTQEKQFAKLTDISEAVAEMASNMKKRNGD